MMTFVQAFFWKGLFLREMNHTFIRLIPKFNGAIKVKHFCPISLCNVCYIVILKILANWLSLILHKMISPLQGAFVPGRPMAKNIVLDKEVAHFMKHNRGDRAMVGFKVGMMMAYDWAK